MVKRKNGYVDVSNFFIFVILFYDLIFIEMRHIQIGIHPPRLMSLSRSTTNCASSHVHHHHTFAIQPTPNTYLSQHLYFRQIQISFVIIVSTPISFISIFQVFIFIFIFVRVQSSFFILFFFGLDLGGLQTKFICC